MTLVPLRTPTTPGLSSGKTSQEDCAFEHALKRGLSGAAPQLDWLVALLSCSEPQAERLYEAADGVRARTLGPEVHLRALLEFSNYCRRNCGYCGLRKSNHQVGRYRLLPEHILAYAHQAEQLGYHTIVLQSGEDMWFSQERLASLLAAIKKETQLAITLSVGERPKDDYRVWKEAGADRFLLRIETTDAQLFALLHPDDQLEERKAALYALRELGYQLGSGVMVGLPGQTPEHLARDICWLYELGAEMIGVGPFIPHPQTPLAQAQGGSVAQTLRLVAVLRLVFPEAHLPATTAMGTLDPQGREKALLAGANVVMPNITPVAVRAQYAIYPNKICLGDDAETCQACLAQRIVSIGRAVGNGPGHVARVAKAEKAGAPPKAP